VTMQNIETAMKWVGTGVCLMGLSVLCIGLVVVLMEVLRRK
jgi:hypothetical protein